MKKLIALLIALFLCMSACFAGCNSNGLAADDDSKSAETSDINGGRVAAEGGESGAETEKGDTAGDKGGSSTGGESGNGDTDGVTQDGSDCLVFSVNTDGETYAVSGIECGEYIVVSIPAERNGKAVTRILTQAFSGSKIAEIRIPGTVTEIGGYAFDGTGLIRAVFDRPDGWSAGEKQVGAVTLSNASYAATYLRQTLKGEIWTRK